MLFCTKRELQSTPNAVPKKLTPDSDVSSPTMVVRLLF